MGDGWLDLSGDTLAMECATESCLNPPKHRLEYDGIGSDYCPNCKSRITRMLVDTIAQGERIFKNLVKEPQRCAECDCESGGNDCNWIESKETD